MLSGFSVPSGSSFWGQEKSAERWSLFYMKKGQVTVMVREAGGVWAKLEQPEASLHWGRQVESVLALRGVYPPAIQLSWRSWTLHQEIFEEEWCLSYAKDIQCINMLLGNDRNEYSNQELGSYLLGSQHIRKEMIFSLEMRSVCSDPWIWFWSLEWRHAEVDRGDSYSHMENWIIPTIPFGQKGWKLCFQFQCKAGAWDEPTQIGARHGWQVSFSSDKRNSGWWSCL